MNTSDLTPSGSSLVSRTIAELRAQQARIDAALTALVALVQPLALPVSDVPMRVQNRKPPRAKARRAAARQAVAKKHPKKSTLAPTKSAPTPIPPATSGHPDTAKLGTVALAVLGAMREASEPLRFAALAAPHDDKKAVANAIRTLVEKGLARPFGTRGQMTYGAVARA